MPSPCVERGESVIFVGESHVLSFGERIVVRDGAPPLTCQAYFLSNAVCLANITTPAGALAAPVRNALRFARLLVETDEDETDEAVFLTERPQWQRIARRRYSGPPLVIFCLGSYDVFRSIDQFPGEDFHLPRTKFLHRLAGPFSSRTLAGATDADAALEWFTARVAPFRAALASLRRLGFARLGALAIPPPTLDNAVCARVVAGLEGSATPGKLRPAFRYKSAMLLNALVAQACEAENAAFLDSWPLLTRDGLVRPDVLSDGAHLNDPAIEAVLLQLVVPVAAATLDADAWPAIKQRLSRGR